MLNVTLSTLIDEEIITLDRLRPKFIDYIDARLNRDGTRTAKRGAQDILQQVMLVMYRKLKSGDTIPATTLKHVRARAYLFINKEMMKQFDRKWRADYEYQAEQDLREEKQNAIDARELVEHFRHGLNTADTIRLERVLLDRVPLAEQFDNSTSQGRVALHRARTRFSELAR